MRQLFILGFIFCAVALQADVVNREIRPVSRCDCGCVAPCHCGCTEGHCCRCNR